MDSIRYDMSQFYPMKAVLEQVFGKTCYRKLKETATLKDWRVESVRLLRAIELAINTTIEVADREWRAEVKHVLDLGHRHLVGATTIADLFAHLSATLTRLVFLQIGQIPNRCLVESVPLTRKYWQLDDYRSVQYVQSDSQAARVQRCAEESQGGRHT